MKFICTDIKNRHPTHTIGIKQLQTLKLIQFLSRNNLNVASYANGAMGGDSFAVEASSEYFSWKAFEGDSSSTYWDHQAQLRLQH